MTAKPSLPQGMRDFTATVLYKRNFILDTIRAVFGLYGFEPLETPAMENLETLTGKYGEEGDKLIFKVLNNGLNDPKNKEKANEGFLKLLAGKATPALTERALKYDLTIPFARHLAMNAGTIAMPYKRYQIQPVWRADRPQRGRYREFTQCDADIAGSASLINEIELCHIYHRCFTQLGLHGYELKINSRKILAALASLAGGADRMTDITVAIDKLDKIGLEKVTDELRDRGLSAEHISIITNYLGISGSNADKLNAIKNLFADSDAGKSGIAELSYVLEHTTGINISIELTLARGLDYYTGIIFEVKAPAQVNMGSIGGGGRYDDLTGLFGLPGIPGVGISFGIDRIFDVMEELSIFPENISSKTTALFFNLGEAEAGIALQQMEVLRNNHISCELYPGNAKMDRQFKYAAKKNIAFAVIIGSKEAGDGTCTIKNLETAEQRTIPVEGLADFFTG